MLTFITRRIASGALLLAVISFLTYVLLSVPDTDVGRQLLGQGADQAAVDAKNTSLGLDRPVWEQYADWLSHAVRGDLGTSWFTSEDVTQAVLGRLPVTASLMLGVTLVTTVVSFLLGVWAGVRRGAVDRVVQVLGVVGYALPGFLVTLVLVLVFAVELNWFPAIGYIPFTDSPGGWLSTITLPVLALSVASVAGVSQQVRGAVIDVLRQDYVRTLRARGLPASRIVLRHVLRNACAPALSVLGMQFVGLLGGAVVVEQIFGLPGIGSMTVTYTTRGDIPVIMALVMLTVVGVVLINLLVDIMIGWLNPKARVA
ncbi:putative ABC transporter permease protein [Streptomyces ambofaciens ATCC 23877]|uniref:Putative ABC transporter permease protein n=1 Tax=Streptomyces ambofaciens (strain ATCC 23877 / 3486 / DSM 40053 / JCM 4204 / NBRC 12836 / NRRL B-2516) TaxID=278992 RepID=A0ACN4_STRA7|nr:ABC transporter permease [Streptomyces ambofaciens]AKZ60104.1 putative ABC transporter permease protein [Streptomyces ambofaciens ATCC 23877]CAJ88239.1 putative ABC transporter permease protein [Streptomyces ambofaciens ATCC 23877]